MTKRKLYKKENKILATQKSRMKYRLYKNSGLNHAKNRRRLLRLNEKRKSGIELIGAAKIQPPPHCTQPEKRKIKSKSDENNGQNSSATENQHLPDQISLKKARSTTANARSSRSSIPTENGCEQSVIPLKKSTASTRSDSTPHHQMSPLVDSVLEAKTTGALSKNQRRRLNAAKRRKRRIMQFSDHCGAPASLLARKSSTTQRSDSALTSSRFRFINEQLYTQTGAESRRMFVDNGDLFAAYHDGYRQQVQKWPVNPLDIIIDEINRLPEGHVIADLGCGEGRLALSVRQKSVHSFDLVSCGEHVRVCDITDVPLSDASCQCVVLCLALMSTDCARIVLEANRLLPIGGRLKIAEVASRIQHVDNFKKQFLAYGFTTQKVDTSYQYFYLFRMRKVRHVTSDNADLPDIELKPCLYKRR